MLRGYFQVSPRYSPGSPAVVDAITAGRVVGAERCFYDCALRGLHGSEERLRAERLGLVGVVEWVEERGGKLFRAEAF